MTTETQQQELDALNNRLWLTECAMTPADHYSRVNVRGIERETLQQWIAEYPETKAKRDELMAVMNTKAQPQYKPRPPTARDLEKKELRSQVLLSLTEEEYASLLVWHASVFGKKAQQEDPTVAYDRAMKVVG